MSVSLSVRAIKGDDSYLQGCSNTHAEALRVILIILCGCRCLYAPMLQCLRGTAKQDQTTINPSEWNSTQTDIHTDAQRNPHILPHNQFPHLGIIVRELKGALLVRGSVCVHMYFCPSWLLPVSQQFAPFIAIRGANGFYSDRHKEFLCFLGDFFFFQFRIPQGWGGGVVSIWMCVCVAS